MTACAAMRCVYDIDHAGDGNVPGGRIGGRCRRESDRTQFTNVSRANVANRSNESWPITHAANGQRGDGVGQLHWSGQMRRGSLTFSACAIAVLRRAMNANPGSATAATTASAVRNAGTGSRSQVAYHRDREFSLAQLWC